MLKNMIALFLSISLCMGANIECVKYPDVQLWGIGVDDVPIYPGEIPVSFILTIKGLTNASENPDDILYINVVNNPDPGFHSVKDINKPYSPPVWSPLSQEELEEEILKIKAVFDPNSAEIVIENLIFNNDPNNRPVTSTSSSIRVGSRINNIDPNSTSEIYGCKLVQYQDTTKGREDLIINFSTINDPNDHIWNIFEQPLSVVFVNGDNINYTSTMLNVMDYMGTGRSFGFLFSPKGKSFFVAEKIQLDVVVQTFNGEHSVRNLIWITNNPPLFICMK